MKPPSFLFPTPAASFCRTRRPRKQWLHTMLLSLDCQGACCPGAGADAASQIFLKKVLDIPPSPCYNLPCGCEMAAVGEWCNGSTYDSDSYCLGSNPSSPVFLFSLNLAPLSRGLGRGPLKAETRVRIPSELLGDSGRNRFFRLLICSSSVHTASVEVPSGLLYNAAYKPVLDF